MRFVLENVKIVSENKRLAYNRKTGRAFTSTEYKQSKACIEAAFIEQTKYRPMYGENVVITITVHTYKDIDNCIKPILDAMQVAGVIKDDRYVVRLLVHKIPIKRGQPDTIIIDVEEI